MRHIIARVVVVGVLLCAAIPLVAVFPSVVPSDPGDWDKGEREVDWNRVGVMILVGFASGYVHESRVYDDVVREMRRAQREKGGGGGGERERERE
jgi:hypothetical protein